MLVRSGSDGRAGEAQQDSSSLRDRAIAAIKAEAPFLTDVQAMGDVVTYSSPLEYQYGSAGSEGPSADTTQLGVTYSSSLSPDELASAMQHIKAGIQSLRRSNLQITRSFQPDPDSFIVRWSVSWLKDGRSALVEGSTKYTLDRQGRIAKQEDAWEVTPVEEGEPPEFPDVLDFCLVRKPAAARGPNSFLPAIRFATWEALKENPNYGGQLTREELDDFTMQMVYACVGLLASLALLLGRVLFLSVSK